MLNVVSLRLKIIVYQRFNKRMNNNKQMSHTCKYSIPSRMMIILKRPIRDIPTQSDIFFV